jgi:hypothetical protein
VSAEAFRKNLCPTSWPSCTWLYLDGFSHKVLEEKEGVSRQVVAFADFEARPPRAAARLIPWCLQRGAFCLILRQPCTAQLRVLLVGGPADPFIQAGAVSRISKQKGG